MATYIQPNERGLFDTSQRLEELHEMGDPLARLDEVVDWSVFNPVFERLEKPAPKAPGGRPAYRPLLMFKALVIQSLYNLSDEQLEFQITDRLSFKRFLGLSEADKSPDAKTFWAFREKLAGQGLVESLFDTFHAQLQGKGLIANKGQMIDATFVEVPRQRNSRQDNARIKAGETPEEWAEQPEKARQKDVDARWAKKNGEKHYGYKNHVKVDSRSKLITDFAVTDAAVHDSQALEGLLEEGDPVTYVDSAYTGAPCENVFKDKNVKARPIEHAYKNKPLNGNQKRYNHARSKIRVRVEHVFGTMRMCMRAAWNRCVGFGRNESAVGMTNLVYNMVRFEQIQRLGLRNWR
jgi:IS5 family transposase